MSAGVSGVRLRPAAQRRTRSPNDFREVPMLRVSLLPAICLSCVVAGSLVTLRAQAGTQPPPAFNPVDTKLVIPVPWADKVTLRENISFKQVAETQLSMDVY